MEDDFAIARDTAQGATRTELSIKSGLDGSRTSQASRDLLEAYDPALRAIYRYAAVAVTYGRAVNAQNIAEQTQYSYVGLMAGGSASPTFGLGAVGTIATASTVSGTTLTVAQMRALMDSSAPDISSIEQSLVAPTRAFNIACPTC